MSLEILYDKIKDEEYVNCWSAETISDCNLVTKSSPSIALTTSANTPNKTFDWEIETIAKDWITNTGFLNNGVQRAKGITTVDTTKYERVCVNGTWSAWIEANPNVNVTNDRLYDGVDLTAKFAAEIAALPYNGDAWAWIKARITAGNFTGIHVGDYIPFTMSSGTVAGQNIAQQSFQAQIAGINTYKGFGDTEVGNHIDFITKTAIDTAFQFQPNDNNNGTSAESNPWLTSKVYAILNGLNNYTTSAYNSVAHGVDASGGGILQLLPAGLRSLIVQKRTQGEQRYNVSGLLTVPNAWAWLNTGLLWLPKENEVYGNQQWSHLYSATNAQIYPLFHSTMNRVKRTSNNTRVSWWLSVPYSGASTSACVVNYAGVSNAVACTNNSTYVPICFRIA